MSLEDDTSSERTWTTWSVLIGIFTTVLTAGLSNISSVQTKAASLPSSIKEFFGAIAGLAGVIAGFIITAKAVLLSIPSVGRAGRTARLGKLKDVVAMMRVTALSAVVVGLASCMLILFSGSPSNLPFLLMLSIWLGAFTTTTITFLLFMHGFGHLATNMMEDRRTDATSKHADDRSQMLGSITEISQPSDDSPRDDAN
jgi:hypothetical protein